MASDHSFQPGYNHVLAFSEAFQDDYEEEVTYVTLDLGATDPAIIPNASTYRLVGLETPTPFLQVGNTVYKGTYETLLGSELLFKDGKDNDGSLGKTIVAHAVASEQRIRFREVVLKKKGKEDADNEDGVDDDDIMDDLKLSPDSSSTNRKGKQKGSGRRGGQTSKPTSNGAAPSS